jgi:hypothetical protein
MRRSYSKVLFNEEFQGSDPTPGSQTPLLRFCSSGERPALQSGYDTYLSRCHSPCKSINRSPIFGCNGSYYVLC